MDPAIYGGAAIFFTAVALLACLVPSMRASRVDPLRALRVD
jgi:ABC-type antimicrobial peptide transport system permease subunit